MALPLDSKLVKRFHPLSLAEIEQIPDPEWLIARHLPQATFTLLYGPPGTYKSFLALDWALSVASGRPWFTEPTKACPVVYIYAEGTFGIKKRCRAWFAERGAAPAAPFYAVPYPVPIPDEMAIGSFVHAVRKAPVAPGLIVVDTLARCFGSGDENSTKDMNAFVTSCDLLRAEWPASTLLVVHHTGKDADRGARGSIALFGATDAAFETRLQAPYLMELHNPRQKDIEQLPARCFNLVEIGGSLVIRASDKLPEDKVKGAGKGAGNETKVWQLLLTSQGGLRRVDLLIQGGFRPATLDGTLKRMLGKALIERQDDRFFALPT